MCLFYRHLLTTALTCKAAVIIAKYAFEKHRINLSTVGTKHCMCKRLFCASSLTPSFVIFRLSKGTEKILKDEKKHHSAVDDFSSKQQFHKSDAITFAV